MTHGRHRPGPLRALAARLKGGDARPRLSDRARSHALALLGDARREVAQADQKASILLAAIGVVISVYFGALLEQKWSPMELPQPWRSLWWAGCAAFGAAMVTFAMVVFPRLGSSRKGRGAAVSSFIDVARCADQHELRRSLERSCVADLDPLTHELRAVSRIAHRKYVLLRLGLLLLAPAAACFATAMAAPALG